MFASKVVTGFELKTQRFPTGNRLLTGPLKVRGLAVLPTNVQIPLPAANEDQGGSVSNGAICINSGFPTDLSSVPTPLQWVVRWSRVDVAGVVHDFLYRHTDCARSIADDVWWELARSGDIGVGRCRAWLCWAVLRGFGSFCRPEQPERRIAARGKSEAYTRRIGLSALHLMPCRVVTTQSGSRPRHAVSLQRVRVPPR